MQSQFTVHNSRFTFGQRLRRAKRGQRFSVSAFQCFSVSSSQQRKRSAFTLLELLIVLGIIAILTVLTAPAFTYIKSGTDITNAAYTIRGLLEQARNNALMNHTYTWVGFFEEDGSSTTPGTAGVGRLVISTVASKDGTKIYGDSPTTLDPTRLVQVGKLVKLDGAHLRTFASGSGTGADTFLTRPPIASDFATAKIGDTSPPDPSLSPFQYPVGDPAPPTQYTFVKAFQFSPRGEVRVDNDNYTMKPVIEVGFQPIRGTVVDNSKDCAIQLNGFSGNIKIYQP